MSPTAHPYVNNGVACFRAVYSYSEPVSDQERRRIERTWESDDPIPASKFRKRRYIQGVGPSKAIAERRCRENIHKKFSGDGTVRRSSAPTVTQYLETWLEHRSQNSNLSAESQRKYRRDIERHILPHIGSRRIDRLSVEELQSLFMKHLDDIGTSARRHTYKTFSAMMNHALKTDVIDVNPLRQVPIPEHTSTVARDDEKFINKRVSISRGMMSWLREADCPHHDHYTLILFMLLGLRRGELLGLEWSSVSSLERKGRASIRIEQQLSRREMSIEGSSEYYLKKRTKTGKDRTILLPETWRKALLAEKKKGRRGNEEWNRDLIFLTPKGDHLNYGTYGKLWKTILHDYMVKDDPQKKLVESDYWRPHAMRHVASSIVYSQGASEGIVRDILGHMDVSQTLHYTHMTREERERAVNGLEAVIFPNRS